MKKNIKCFAAQRCWIARHNTKEGYLHWSVKQLKAILPGLSQLCPGVTSPVTFAYTQIKMLPADDSFARVELILALSKWRSEVGAKCSLGMIQKLFVHLSRQKDSQEGPPLCRCLLLLSPLGWLLNPPGPPEIPLPLAVGTLGPGPALVVGVTCHQGQQQTAQQGWNKHPENIKQYISIFSGTSKCNSFFCFK